MILREKLNRLLLVLFLVSILFMAELIKDWTADFDESLTAKTSFLNAENTYTTPTAFDDTEGGVVVDKLVYGDLQSPNFKIGVEGWKIDKDGNIIAGSIFYNKNFIHTTFESLDGWTSETVGTGAKTLVFNHLGLSTGANNGSSINLYIDITLVPTFSVSMAKNPSFQTNVKLSATTEQTAFWIYGYNTEDSFGFRVDNGTLSAYYTKTGNEYTSTISGITLTDLNEYKAILTSGVDIKFYVNNILQYTATTIINLPSSTSVNRLFEYWISNDEASNKVLYTKYLIINEDK